MPVRISGDGTFAGLTSVETVNVLHPDAVTNNIVLADDGSVALDSIPASIQSAIDAAGSPGIGSNVVQTVKTDTFTLNSTTFTGITGLSVTITPSSAASKILIFASIGLSMAPGGGPKAVHLRLNAGGAFPFIGDTFGSLVRATAMLGMYSDFDLYRVDFDVQERSIFYLHSPVSTSPVSYSIEMRTTGSFNGFVNRMASSESARVASSITAIEVAA